jgi:hypothetical protein
MNLNDMFPSKYLKAADLEGKTVVCKIEGIIPELIKSNEGPDERKAVMYVQGSKKGLILNRTNAGVLGGLYGPETDEWTGKRVTMFVCPVVFQGRTVDAIRLKAPPPAAAKPATPAPVALASNPDAADPTDDDLPF